MQAYEVNWYVLFNVDFMDSNKGQRLFWQYMKNIGLLINGSDGLVSLHAVMNHIT